MLNTVAPVSLLQAEGIPAPAKVVWMAAALVEEELSVAALARASGMTLPTVRRALAMLARLSGPLGRTGAAASAGQQWKCRRPWWRHGRLAPRVRCCMGCSSWRRGGGSAGTSRQSRTCVPWQARATTVTLAVKELVRCGWLRVVREQPGRPAVYVLLDPDLHRQRFLMVLAKRRVSRAKHKGEALMREWLSVLVASELFADEAAPEWLVNPQTGEQLRFDRYYHAGVAWEYNGAQHYRATDWFPGDEEARVRCHWLWSTRRI